MSASGSAAASGERPQRRAEVLSVQRDRHDTAANPALRPRTLDDFVGQQGVLGNLRVYIVAARTRGQTMDHVLLHGAPGLGKTTLAQIVATELGVGFRQTSGPAITKSGDLAALLTTLQPRDVLFIDEIHRLPPAVEEVLYPAMEDHQLDLMIGDGPGARSVRIDLAPFTLIGATTRAGMLTNPLRDRFGILLELRYYTAGEIGVILAAQSKHLGVELLSEASAEIARRSRGTPRIAGRLLRRVADFALVETQDGRIDKRLALSSMESMDVDGLGLDRLDRGYLLRLGRDFGGGPTGVETLAAALSHGRDTLEELVEPFLIQSGLIQRTPRGRLLTTSGWRYLGLTPPNLEGLFTDPS